MRHSIKWLLLDALVIAVGYSAAATLMFADILNPFIAFVIVVNWATLQALGAYKRIWRLTSGEEIELLIESGILAGILLTISTFIVSPQPIRLSVLAIGQLLAIGGFAILRYRYRLIRGLAWRWNAIWRREFPTIPTRVLIVGAGNSGGRLATFLRHPLPGQSYFRVIGYADDDLHKQRMHVEGLPILGTIKAIPELVDLYQIDLIILAIHNVSSESFRRVLDICQASDAQVKVMPDVLKLIEEPNVTETLRDVTIEDIIGRAPVGLDTKVDFSGLIDRRVMVTGAAGSIGSELCRQLLAYGMKDLILLDINESGLFDLMLELRTLSPDANLSVVLCDVADPFPLENAFRQHRPQVIFHSAAYKHVPMLEGHPYAAVRTNIGGTYNAITLAQKYEAERFVLISTDKAVNPSCVMGATKAICEKLIHALHDPNSRTLLTSVRLGNVLGSRGSVVTIFERQIAAGGPVQITDERMTRYFMSVPEAARLIIQAACLTRGDDLFILEMGESVRIVDLAERMIRLRGLRPYKDIPIEFIGIRVGEKLYEELIAEHETRQPTVHPYIIEIKSEATHTNLAMYKSLLNGSLKAPAHTLIEKINLAAKAELLQTDML